MTAPVRGRPEPAWLYALAGALLLGGPVWHALWTSHYPFHRPEAIVLPLGAALVGAGLALAAHRLPAVLATLSFGVLLCLFVDLQFDWHLHVRSVLILAGCLVFAQVFRTRRALLVCLMAAAFDLSSLARAPEVPGRAAATRAEPVRTGSGPPLLLHIIMDEQWGIGGFRAAGDSGTAELLSVFYRERGFEVYEGAYSRDRWTRFSIPELMSLSRPHEVREVAGHYWLPRNAWFEWLAGQGYRIRVAQTTHLDFCRAQGITVASCRVTPGGSLGNIGYLEGRWLVRAARAFRFLLNAKSHYYVRLRSPPDAVIWKTASVGRGLDELRKLRADITREPARGTAYVIHVLLPHRPIEVDSACHARSPSGDERWTRGAHMSAPDAAAWQAAYGGQVRCLHHALDGLLRTADSVAGGEGIVIIHGDHGTRMSLGNGPLSQFEERQLNAAFSTLFAIRRPRATPAAHSMAVPIQDLFWTLVDSSFAGTANGAWRHFVRDRGRRGNADTLRLLEPAEMIWAGTGHPGR